MYLSPVHHFSSCEASYYFRSPDFFRTMNPFWTPLLLSLLLSATFSSAQNTQLVLDNGTRITSSCIVARTEYILDANASLDSFIIIIEGNNIEADFSNA